MKNHYYFPIMIAMMMLGCLSFASCMEDETYDLENLGSDLEIETSVALPIATVDFYLKDVFDIENVKGKIVDKAGNIYDLSSADVTTESMSKLMPLSITSAQGFYANNIVEGLDLDQVFGEGNVVKKIEKLKITLDYTSDVPLDMTVGLDFTDDMYPNSASKGLLGMSREVTVAASNEAKSSTTVFEYGDVTAQLGSATAMMIPLSFKFPENTSEVQFINVNDKQKVHLVVKLWVKGVVSTSDI